MHAQKKIANVFLFSFFFAVNALGNINGKKIALCGPSSPIENIEEYEESLALLKKLGAEIVYDGPSRRVGEFDYLNGHDAERVAELEELFALDHIDVVWAKRGGYGLTRILPDLKLPAEEKKRFPVVIGFSDVSALLMHLWATQKIKSIHGPVLQWLRRVPKEPLSALEAILDGRAQSIRYPAFSIDPFSGYTDSVEGTLIVANLSLLIALIGTKSMPSLDGAILILEDDGEAPYRVDRLLTQLWASGCLVGLKAVILGAFSDSGSDENAVQKIFASRFRKLGIPVFSGMHVGHINDNWAVPIGVRARVQIHQGKQASLQILEEICD